MTSKLPNFISQETRKKEQIKPKVCRRRKIAKIITEINEMKTREY